MRRDFSKVVDHAKFGRFQACVLVLCFVIVMIDGYDLVVMGVALPTIISEMQMDPGVAGIIASCALIGMMFGAIFMGTLADRVGRVATIVACVSVFSVFTAATGMARDPGSFAALRLIAGLGLGGVIPCITATMADYSPTRLRGRLTTVMLSGYPLGGVLAALLGKHFIHAFGWQYVFFVASSSLLLIPVILKLMPESPVILHKRGNNETLRRLMRSIDRSQHVSNADEMYVPLPVHHARIPVASLFSESRSISTLMLWTGYFSGLFMLYGLNSWLPKLMSQAGFSLGAALTFLMLMNFGSIVGSFLGGWLSDRFGLKRVLTIMLLCGAVAIAIAAQQPPAQLLSMVIFVVGMTASGAQGVANAYVAQFYPAGIRATGIGMALGVGRIGGITAPIVIGLLISRHLPVQQVFYVIAAFGILQAVATLLVDDRVADFAASRPARTGLASTLPTHPVADETDDLSPSDRQHSAS